VHTWLEALRAFKRDLQNLGISNAHIFEIIPDGTPASSDAKTPLGRQTPRRRPARTGARTTTHFVGPTMQIGHVELRSAAVRVTSQRLGAVLFYDVGDAASSFAAMTINQEVGVGLRWLIPQLNAAVIRID